MRPELVRFVEWRLSGCFDCWSLLTLGVVVVVVVVVRVLLLELSAPGAPRVGFEGLAG